MGDDLEITIKGDGSTSYSLDGLPLRVVPCEYGVLEDGEVTSFGQAADRAEAYVAAHAGAEVVWRILGGRAWRDEGRRQIAAGTKGGDPS